MEIVGQAAIEMIRNVCDHVTLAKQRAALNLFNDQLTDDEEGQDVTRAAVTLQLLMPRQGHLYCL